jgi:hypothetical protein
VFGGYGLLLLVVLLLADLDLLIPAATGEGPTGAEQVGQLLRGVAVVSFACDAGGLPNPACASIAEASLHAQSTSRLDKQTGIQC